MLAPGEQLWMDVAQLIRGQVPDSDGNTMPPDTMTGSYELRDLDHATVGLLYEGKLIIDKTYGHASYGCAICCGYLSASLTPDPFYGPVGIDNPDIFQAEEQCGGYWDDVTGSAYSWNSSNTAVATLPTRTLHTVAVGSATGGALNLLQASHPAPRCPQQLFGPQQPVTVSPTIDSISPPQSLVGTAVSVTINGTGFSQGDSIQAGPSITVSGISVSSSTALSATFTIENSSTAGGSWNISVKSSSGQTSNSKTFFVQIPQSLQLISSTILATGTTGDYGCTPSADFGIVLDLKYQVLDQQNPPQTISNAAMVPHETANLSPPIDQDICPSRVSTCTHATAADGTWHDAPFGGCAAAAFSTSYTQNVTMIVGAKSYAVRTNNMSLSSSSAGHGSITNGSDINKSR